MAFTGQLGRADSKLANIELGGPTPLTGVAIRPKAIFEINFSDNPTTLEFASTGYTDVSNRIRSFSSRRGRPTQFERVEAGIATVVLDNRDGYFNPDQSGRLLMRKARLSAYYDAQTFPILTGFIESYQYEYPSIDHDAICIVTISEGQKLLALQQFGTDYVRENETAPTRLASVFAEAGIGATYYDISSATIDTTNELAPLRVTEPLTPPTQTRSSTLANGSTSVTVSSSVGLVVGMDVAGTGIAAETTIAAIPDSTHITLNQGAVLANTQVDVGATRAGNVLTGLDTDPLSVGMGVSSTNRYGQSLFPASTTISAIQGGSVTLSTAMNDFDVQEGYTLASCTLANASTSVTVSSTSNLRPGMQVSGTGIPQGTEIVSIDSGTTLTISKPAVLSFTQIDASGARANNVLGDIDTSTLSVGMAVDLKNNRYGNAIFQSSTTIAEIAGNSVTLNKTTNDVPFWEGYNLSTTLTNDSTSVTVSSTSNLRVGMQAVGVGLPFDDTTIASIDSGTTLTLSKKAFTNRSKTTGGHPNSPNLQDIYEAFEVSVGMLVGPAQNNSAEEVFGSSPDYQATVIEKSATSVVIDPPTNNVTFWDGTSTDGYIDPVSYSCDATSNRDFVSREGHCKVSFSAGTSQTLTFLGAVNHCKVSFSAGTSQTLTFPRPYLSATRVLDHIREIEATERGLFVVLANGKYQYQGKSWRAAETAQLTFGENAGEVPYSEVPIAYDDSLVANEYQLHNVYNEDWTSITDATSQARYFRRVEQIDQHWYQNVTSLPLDQRAFEPIPRLQGVLVKPIRDPLGLWVPLLSLSISKRVNVRRRPMGGSDFFSSYSQFIEGVQHDADPSEWNITFLTSPWRSAS